MLKNTVKMINIGIIAFLYSYSGAIAKTEDSMFLTQDQKLIIAEVYLMNGLKDEAQKTLIDLAKNGHAESQYILYNDIMNGIIKDVGFTQAEIDNLLTSSAKNGYIPAIQQRVIQIERDTKSDVELLKNEEWTQLVQIGFEKEDIGFALSYAKWKIYNEKVTENEYILEKLEKIAEKTFNEEVIMFLGDYYSLIENDAQKSKNWYLKAVRMGSSNAANNLAYFWADRDIFLDEALELSKLAVGLDANPSNIDTLSWIYFKKKELDKAYDLIKKAYSQDSTNWEIVFHKGMIEKELGLNQESVSSFMKALDMINELGQKETVDKFLPDLLKELNDLIEKSHI